MPSSLRRWWPHLAVTLLVVLGLAAAPTYRDVLLSGAGLAQGALIAGIALGIVLTYRGAGVVNLANGTIAAYAAYTYALLRAEGDLFLPPLPNPLVLIEAVANLLRPGAPLTLPDLPTRISFGDSLSFWPSLTIALACCIVLGAALHVGIFHRLRNAPPLARAVASVGVFLLLQAIIIRRFAGAPRPVAALPFLDKTTVQLGPLQLARDQLAVVAFVLLCTVLLTVVFQRSRFGLATRAAAENERAAIVLGLAPQRLAAANWILSTVLTGLVGISVASVNSNVDPLVISALVIPALTAALVGRFTSFGTTALTAFLLGSQLPLVQHLSVEARWFPQVDGLPVPGVETIVPLMVILTVLFVRGTALPTRGALPPDRLVPSPAPSRRSLTVTGPAVTATAIVAMLFWLAPPLRMALTSSAIGVILCLSVVVVTGLVGQLSLAPMAFAGISAFTAAALSSSWGWPFPLAMLTGALIATAVGLLAVIPALRIRGVQLAIVTLAFGVAMDRFVFSNRLVNGGVGGAPVRRPSYLDQTDTSVFDLGGLITVGDGRQPNALTGVFCIVVAAGLCYGVAQLRRSPTGRRMLALRSNEKAAAACGVNVAATKALAFGISAFIAGIGGAVMAYRQGGAFPGAFSYEASLVVLALAYVGGIARTSGAIAGGLLVSGGVAITVGQHLGVPDDATLLLAGAGLVVTVVAHPAGITGRLGVSARAEPSPLRAPKDRADAQPTTTAVGS